MAISRMRPCAWVCAALAANILLLSSQALAQLGGGGGLGGGGLGGGGLGGGLGGGAGGGGTIGSQGGSGVVIDADGVLRTRHFRDPTGRLTRQRLLEARAALDRDVAQASRLRKISLVRLEAALRDRLERNAGLTETMRCMAGLTRIQYVFYYPQTRDIVLAGPAEGWGEDLSGRTIGLQSGRPTILLEDLLVALRAFPPTGASTPAIYCSIDPTPEGLTRMQQFLRRVGSRATPSDTQFIVAGLRNSLGPQKVTIGGVPASSHFAQVLVEADYRMKLIGIGLEQPPVKLTSYVARANPAAVSRNALERWYFVPNYECVRVSEDTLAMELVGLGVKLISESELVGQDGGRTSARRTNRASQMFVGEFTRKYPALAARAPVFAQLRNMIDLAVAAAFIQQQDYYSQAAWTLGVLGDEQILPVETLPAPRFAETAVNSLWKGNRLMTPIGGGVQIRPTQALDPDRILPDDDRLVAAARGEVELSALEDLQWWWD